MIQPGKLTLQLYRYTPFSYLIEFPAGIDFTEATFKAEIREYPNAPTALVTLENAASNAEGISVTTETIGGAIFSTVRININETTIEGILPAESAYANAGAAVDLDWDLHITGGGFPKTRWLEGDVIINEGVTQ